MTNGDEAGRTDRVLVVCASHSPGMARDHQQQQGLEFRAGLAAARELVERFVPELAIVFGPDHRRTLTTLVPPFTVAFSARGLGDMGTSQEAYDVPQRDVEALTEHLLGERFDVAVGRDITLDHGFGQTVADLVGPLGAVPTIPIIVNCATPPLPPMSRVHDLGRAVGDFARRTQRNILVVGSGGLSHAPPSLAPDMIGASEEQRAAANRDGRRAAAKRIDPEWDRRFLDALAADDRDWLRCLPDPVIDEAGWGAHEIRTWVAAQAAGAHPLTLLAYEPVDAWITGMGVAASRLQGINGADRPVDQDESWR